MKLKGDWNEETSYSIGDVVRYTDGNIYHLFKPCAAGITPIDTLYWVRTSQIVAIAAGFALDVQEAIPKNIDDQGITLKTDDGEYLITVDDSGDTPELEVTELEEPAEEGDS